jgi:hypothetical protein
VTYYVHRTWRQPCAGTFSRYKAGLSRLTRPETPCVGFPIFFLCIRRLPDTDVGRRSFAVSLRAMHETSLLTKRLSRQVRSRTYSIGQAERACLHVILSSLSSLTFCSHLWYLSFADFGKFDLPTFSSSKTSRRKKRKKRFHMIFNAFS